MIAKTKIWGNSLAVIIPNSKVLELKLKPGEEINLQIEKQTNVLKELFGSIKFDKSVEEVLKEARKNTSKWE